jgi:hypothetical protein
MAYASASVERNAAGHLMPYARDTRYAQQEPVELRPMRATFEV